MSTGVLHPLKQAPELAPRPLNHPPTSREEASAGALGASLPAPSKLDASPESTGTAEDDPAPESVLPIAIKLEFASDMETDASSDTLPVAAETNASPSPPATDASHVIEPGSSSSGAEGAGGAALSQTEDDAPTQKLVAQLCGTRLQSHTQPVQHKVNLSSALHPAPYPSCLPHHPR